MAVIVPFESRTPSTINRLTELVAHDMERVNATILSRTGSQVTMIPEVANHLISSGGKRLRPMLTLAMARLAGYSGDGHVKLAAAVEFMHTATLLHDDVVDESEMRRGKLAARMLWGNEASVLVGDFLLGQAFKMMVEVGIAAGAGNPLLGGRDDRRRRGDAARRRQEYRHHRGRVSRRHPRQDRRAVRRRLRGRPGTLAARPKDEHRACRSFGMNLGIAFQLVDDALDYGGKAAKLGKNVGDDFREGKITLPVVLSFRRGSESERAFWRRALEKARRRDADLEHAIALMTQAPRAGGYHPARAPLWRDGQGRARAVSGFADEGGAGRGGRILHRALELDPEPGMRRDR